MTTKRPFMQVFASDWRADPKLRLCSIAARGLWWEMVGIMHEAEPYGHLVIAGQAPTVGQIARLCGVGLKICSRLLSELRLADVYSVTDGGIIFSRRMVRDEEKRKKNKENGAKGGNPQLKPSVNPEDTPHIPYPRVHTIDSDERRIWASVEKKSGNRERKKPAISLPDDWVPKVESVQAAQKLGFTPAETAREAQKFRNHAKQNDRKAVRWDAAFDNWMINAAGFHGKQPKPENGSCFKAMPDFSQFEAWRTYHRDQGNAAMVRELERRREENRPFDFPSEWPPGYKAA